MREFIIRDWKAQETAAEADPGDEDGKDVREEPAAVRHPPPPPAPRAAEAPAAPSLAEREAARPEASAERKDVAEPEDQTLGGAIRVKRFPAVAAASSRPREERAPATRAARTGAPQRKRGERRFIIAYDGVFVGFFEAAEEVTPREAYVRVAQDLAEDETFDPEKLSLYKPVLLRSARPSRGVNVIRGKMARLSWQPRKATLVPEPEAEERATLDEAEDGT